MKALGAIHAVALFVFVVVSVWVVGEAGGPPWAQVMTGVLVTGQMLGKSKRETSRKCLTTTALTL